MKFCFYQKKMSSMKQADLRDMFQKDSKSTCTSTVGVSSLVSSQSPISAMKTPGNRGTLVVQLMDIVAVWLIDFFFLQDCGMYFI